MEDRNTLSRVSYTLDLARSIGLAVVVCGLSSTAALAQAPEWSLVPTRFEVGGFVEDERYSLSEVVGATRLADGRIVIADRFVQGLRLFAADGSYLKTVGREGEGPGEYVHIRGLGPCAEDRVVAFDLHWGWKVYDVELNLEEEYPPEIPGLGGTAYDYACDPSGTFVATGLGDTRAQFKSGYYVATAPVVLGRSDDLIRDFGERLSSERIGTVRSDGTPAGSGPHPFGRGTRVAIGGGRVYIGDGGDYDVEVYDLNGGRLSPITWIGPGREITGRDMKAYEEAVLAAVPESGETRARRGLRDLPELERFPAYNDLRVDRLWSG